MREIGRERESARERKREGERHTHTHTQRERERERERVLSILLHYDKWMLTFKTSINKIGSTGLIMGC